MLHRSGLVISEVAGPGPAARQTPQRRRSGGVDRQAVQRLRPAVSRRRSRAASSTGSTNTPAGSLRRPRVIVLHRCSALSALLLVIVQFDEFHSQAAGVSPVLRPEELDSISASRWARSRCCTSSGTDCPANTSAANVTRWARCCSSSRRACIAMSPTRWMLPNKWHRAAIGAAGMYVELFLASIATFRLVVQRAGPAELTSALSMMFICSVSTVMFNGNPLLRFDGYYILMDILEIPNLRQKSTRDHQAVLRLALPGHRAAGESVSAARKPVGRSPSTRSRR